MNRDRSYLAIIALLAVMITAVDEPLWSGELTLRARRVKVVDEKGAVIPDAHVMRMSGNNEHESYKTDENGMVTLPKRNLLFEDPDSLYISRDGYNGKQIYYEEFETMFKGTNQATVTLKSIPRPKIETSNLLNKRDIDEFIRNNYPPADFRAGISTRVIVDIIIDNKGNVSRVEIAVGANKKFDAVAMKAAYKMKYSPMSVDGKPVGSQTRTTIIFNADKR